MMKILTIVGTRPEIIRLSEIIKKLDQHFEQLIVHTGQNYDYELNDIFFNDLELRNPDIYLDSGRDAKSPAEQIGNIISKTDEVMASSNPDAILVLGDTNSCLSVIPAKRRKIPIFHYEAGNRCFDKRVPEEINRCIVDHTSDINLTYSSIAREYLLREGLPPDQIIKVGSPMKEVLNKHRAKIKNSTILERLGLKPSNYYIASLHREENLSINNFKQILIALNQIVEKKSFPVVVSTHPRTQKYIDKNNLEIHPKIQLIKPVSFTDYISLQQRAIAVLSDSGTITEESSILGFKALNIRPAHERPEGMEQGAVIMTGSSPSNILASLESLSYLEPSIIVDDYNVDDVSSKVVKIIFSYTHYVNSKVWKKENE